MDGVDLPRVIGHRGAAATAPENTLAGFLQAARLGVRWVELDVQLSADDVPVVFHDDRLERTTDGHGRLVETPLSVLRQLDAGAWFDPGFRGERLPTLAEALTAIAGAGLGLCLEVKADEAWGERTARIALATARQLWPADRPPPMVSSFSRSALAAAARVQPDWPRGFLVDTVPEDWADQVRRYGCTSLHTRHGELAPARVRAMKEAGLAVLGYTVNDCELAQALWGAGVDAVFSDYPERLLTIAR